MSNREQLGESMSILSLKMQSIIWKTYLSGVKELFLEIPEFKIMSLPENGIEFLSKTNGNCIYCNKKNIYSYICLLCGNKICNNINCFIDDPAKGKKEYSLIYHSKKCCGGNGILLDIKNTEIIYIFKRRIIKSNIFIYMNNFGETLKDSYLADDYKLNKDELNKGIIKFIDMTYRKKAGKIYFINGMN